LKPVFQFKIRKKNWITQGIKYPADIKGVYSIFSTEEVIIHT
jgi:hypothetical protein